MPSKRRWTSIVLALVGLALGRDASAWITGSPPAPLTYDIALDADGDVVAAGSIGGGPNVHMVVTKFAGGVGVSTWSAADLAPGVAGRAVATDSVGDVYAAGTWFPGNLDPLRFLFAAKLSGADGSVLWQRSYLNDSQIAPDGIVGPLVVLPSGDVVAAVAHTTATGAETMIVRLAGATGSEVWTRTLQQESLLRGGGVVVDPLGDVIIGTSASGGQVRVRKLAGSSGADAWTYEGTFTGVDAIKIALHATDPVMLASSPRYFGTPYGSVVRLDGTTGAESWRWDAPGTVQDLAVGSDGDVYVQAADDFVRLDGGSGAVEWTAAAINPLAFVLDDDGDVLSRVATGDWPLKFVRLSASTGAILWGLPLFGEADSADHYPPKLLNGPRGIVGFAGSRVFEIGTRLAGRKLVVKQTAGDASRDLLRLSSKDPLFSAPTRGPFGGPYPQQPTVNGATLTLENPSTSEAGVFVLPAVNWTISPPGQLGGQRYRYKDPSSNPGCRVALGGGKLKVTCKGSLGGFTVDEASQNALRVTMNFGVGGPLTCLEFGGVVRDVAGSFTAKNAAAPAACDGI